MRLVNTTARLCRIVGTDGVWIIPQQDAVPFTPHPFSVVIRACMASSSAVRDPVRVCANSIMVP